MPTLNFKAKVPVFDANVRVGDRRDEVAPSRNRADLLAEMDRHGVDKALIYHAQGELLSPVDGNRFLEEWLSEGSLSNKDDRLEAQWMMMPTAESLNQIKALHTAGRARAVRLHNSRSAGLPFRSWAYDEMLSWLSDAGIPLWIPLPESDADELMDTLQRYPKLVTVLVGAHYSHYMWVRPMLQALPNSYLELSRFEPMNQFEALSQDVGADRLLYGSWYSNYAMGPILFYTHHCGWNDEQLALVCAGNLERILAGGGQRD
ncbi:MAG: putative TIM-barrel fold metal-dependent hydrolase [Cellvibrionaceae bacterium]|jgi:predicted TIM-barrel fold metal-dependent hydrolase